ncbi:endonuclease/exonuclease/phosphatase family protein [Bremerella cremea]|uniref:Endonuclease/exonuclease/phosphatase family protein n=1 Tax=Bremerella cremea TaxID=1031537 RepID=A0A368KJ83_9BACT|nr:endonuclease/exonuclease/phosphatase family protein [Bremerella cremea]RCS40612.1 endonuclease/exonuclease/phosphatase family protein [Bremerella cremea]
MTNEAAAVDVSAKSWWPKIRDFVWARAKLLVILLVALTLLTLFAQGYWVFDLLANLRVQQVLLGLFLLAVCGLYHEWKWMAVVALCLLFHLPAFASLFRGQGVPLAEGHLTVTVSNVLSSNQNINAILTDALQDDPDVLVFLELTSWQAAEISQRTKSHYPHAVVRPSDFGNFGIGLYSKYPFDATEVFQLNEKIDSIEARITVDNHRYRIIGTHPLPPVRAAGFASRNEHLHELAARLIHKKDHRENLPTIVVGDLNVTPWSPCFAEIANPLSGLRRAAIGFDVTPTWYVLPIFPLGLTLDHALITEDLVCTKKRIGGPIGSDHRSVTVTVAPRGFP